MYDDWITLPARFLSLSKGAMTAVRFSITGREVAKNCALIICRPHLLKISWRHFVKLLKGFCHVTCAGKACDFCNFAHAHVAGKKQVSNFTTAVVHKIFNWRFFRELIKNLIT